MREWKVSASNSSGPAQLRRTCQPHATSGNETWAPGYCCWVKAFKNTEEMDVVVVCHMMWCGGKYKWHACNDKWSKLLKGPVSLPFIDLYNKETLKTLKRWFYGIAYSTCHLPAYCKVHCNDSIFRPPSIRTFFRGQLISNAWNVVFPIFCH